MKPSTPEHRRTANAGKAAIALTLAALAALLVWIAATALQ